MRDRLTEEDMERMATECASFAEEYGRETALEIIKFDSSLHTEDKRMLLAYAERKLIKQEGLH